MMRHLSLRKFSRPHAKVLVAGLLAVSLSACSFWNRDPNRIPATLKETPSLLGVKQAWSVDVGKSDTYVFHPIVVGDSVYASGIKGKVMRVEVATGRIVWETNADATVTAGPGSDGNVTAVGSLKGDVFAYDNTGKQIWKEKVGSEVLTEPLVGQGMVIVRTIDSRIVALDAKTGRRLWVYQRSQTPLNLRSALGMVFVGNALVTGFPGGKIGALNLSNGTIRWESTVTYAKGFSEIERLIDVAGTPAVYGSRVCAVAFQGRIGCFDVNNGSPIWGQDFSSSTGVSQDADYVFSSDEKSRLYAFDANRGTRAWYTEDLIWRRLGEPISLGRSVVVGDFEGYVHWLSRQNGEFLARMKTDGSAISAAPVVSGQTMIVQTRDGGLFAFVPN